MLAYWDTDLNKSVDLFLNPICILLVVCTSTIAVCIAIYANKILFKLSNIIKSYFTVQGYQNCKGVESRRDPDLHSDGTRLFLYRDHSNSVDCSDQASRL